MCFFHSFARWTGTPGQLRGGQYTSKYFCQLPCNLAAGQNQRCKRPPDAFLSNLFIFFGIFTRAVWQGFWPTLSHTHLFHERFSLKSVTTALPELKVLALSPKNIKNPAEIKGHKQLSQQGYHSFPCLKNMQKAFGSFRLWDIHPTRTSPPFWYQATLANRWKWNTEIPEPPALGG